MPGGWKICLQPFLVPSGFEFPWGICLILLLLECFFSKAGLVPVEAACRIGSVLSGHKQWLFAQRTGSVWVRELCLHLDILSCPRTSLHLVFSGTGNTASVAFLGVKEYRKGFYL